MRLSRTYIAILLGFLCIAATSCKKKEILTFGGKMDQFAATDPEGSKTYLGHAEEWIYWESGDQIKVNDGNGPVNCTLITGAGTLNAFFESESEVNAEAAQLFAIYPASSYVNGSTVASPKIVFPSEQEYRQDANATDPDSSFGRGALPMVAYDGTGMAQQGTMFFHVVAGILRVQLFSNTEVTVNEITFQEVGGLRGSTYKQISGQFNVHDIKENAPYLTGTTVSDASRTIKITNIGKKIGPQKLLTFYLPLPAVGSASNYTEYILRMTVKGDGGSKYFTRDFKADIHRRNITMMRAINITTWSASETGSGSQSDVRLVGSGTKDRPFQIYTGKELEQLRDAYNNGGTINGQTIRGYSASDKENATYIKIVRSDIILSNAADIPTEELDKPNSRYANWNIGIMNFKGYMYFASSTATNGGITNQSNRPLFENIDEDGYVERVFVKGTCTPSLSTGSSYSPMCNINRGTMVECHNKCAVSTNASNAKLAGLCVTNYGSIIGGANEASLTSSSGSVAGICYTNRGEIQGNFTLSIALPQALNIAGITYDNYNTVKDCQVASNVAVNSTGNWGIVAFNNNAGATIDNCTTTGTVVFTIDGSVGGICNTNSGTVKNCTNNVEIRATKGNVGGIVATMDNASAEVYNCCTRTLSLFGAVDLQKADNIGGIVGMLQQGKVYNCYNASIVTGAENSGGMIGYLANNPAADVQNCWSAQGQGFVGMYEDATQHQVGDFCFSATIRATHCNRITNSSTTIDGHSYNAYEVVMMHEDQTAYGPVSNFLYKHCGIALDAWVDAHNATEPGKYYKWKYSTGTRPVFDTGMPGKGKRK